MRIGGASNIADVELSTPFLFARTRIISRAINSDAPPGIVHSITDVPVDESLLLINTIKDGVFRNTYDV